MDNNGIDYFSRKHPLRKVASRISFSTRKRMFDFFMNEFKPDSVTKILDVGVTPDESLPESNYFEKWYPFPSNIVATGIEDVTGLASIFEGVMFVKTENLDLPFACRSFDIVFCSAVLEHVGCERNQRKFVSELLRVGKSFFILTPNRFFPVEFHTFLPLVHWLPQEAHQSLLQKMGKGFWAQTKNLNLLSTRTLAELFPDDAEVRIKKIRLLGMTSNLAAYGRSPL